MRIYGEAAALEIIRKHVSEHGDKLQLSQVLSGGSNEIAGLGVDKATAVRVNVPVRDISGNSPEGARNKLFPGGILSGTLACRAVLLESGVSERFTGVPDLEDALYLRTRFQYQEPSIRSLPGALAATALTVGGPVTHIAVHNFLPGDGEQLDDYYERLAAHEAALKGGGIEAVGPEPVMPALRTHYGLDLPPVPNFRGVDPAQRANDRLQVRRVGFNALQEQVPAARVLSLSNQGYVSEGELMDWAEAFTAVPEDASAAS